MRGLQEVRVEPAPTSADEALMGVRADIEQVRVLLADAAGALASHFSSIVRIARGLSAELDGAGGPLTASAVCIAQEAESAVVGMQFQDLVDQLLAQALARLDAARDAAGEDGAGCPREATGDGAPQAHRIAQRSMAPGDIELF